MNDLVGVLMRFRQDKIAIAADTEQMFHQVRVAKEDRDSQRFLWWPDGDTSKPAEVYCMQGHVFGVTSSPSCTAFALRRAAEDQMSAFSAEVVSIVNNSFYVDDCLKSLGTPGEAISLVGKLRKLLANRGFRLHKWISNDLSVIRSILVRICSKHQRN